MHVVEGSPAGITSTIVGVTVFVFASMAYVVRHRDRFQKESDDLLHAILADEIAQRLKSERTMIADAHESASVLFADVVGFTPMSATMSPHELVGLLNTVFTTFDGFVEELGLEKIKTVGDEYMVAAGVPHSRSDHAQPSPSWPFGSATIPSGTGSTAMRSACGSGPIRAQSSAGSSAPTSSPTTCGVMS
jgi:class 3 adenylate cyclase